MQVHGRIVKDGTVVGFPGRDGRIRPGVVLAVLADEQVVLVLEGTSQEHWADSELILLSARRGTRVHSQMGLSQRYETTYFYRSKPALHIVPAAQLAVNRKRDPSCPADALRAMQAWAFEEIQTGPRFGILRESSRFADNCSSQDQT